MEKKRINKFHPSCSQTFIPCLDLTKLKDIEWEKVCDKLYFTPEGSRNNWLDYTDDINVYCSQRIFRQRTFKTAKESGMSMLRTLNFTCDKKYI